MTSAATATSSSAYPLSALDVTCAPAIFDPHVAASPTQLLEPLQECGAAGR